MKLKSILSSLTFFFLAQCVFAQEKRIQLEDICASRTFSPEWVWGINSMNDGIHYSSLNYGDKNVYITQYSYETGDSISTIVDSKDLDGISFNNYSFSEDENKDVKEAEKDIDENVPLKEKDIERQEQELLLLKKSTISKIFQAIDLNNVVQRM